MAAKRKPSPKERAAKKTSNARNARLERAAKKASNARLEKAAKKPSSARPGEKNDARVYYKSPAKKTQRGTKTGVSGRAGAKSWNKKNTRMFKRNGINPRGMG